MPFELRQHPPRRIAVIGGGISGMAAAHLLADGNSVVLFEAAARLGGHARTVVAGRRGDQPVDTGFIVFNKVNYPHLVKLFQDLDVPIAKSDMSFGASIAGGALEFGLRDMTTVFAQKRNLLRPNYLRMLRDIERFNRTALKAATSPDMTISDLLKKLGTGDWFRDYFILPLSGAIWSVPPRQILEFPAQTMMRFFENHALLSHTGQHEWWTVEGGSVQYVNRLSQRLANVGVDVRLSAGVTAVRRTAFGAEVRAVGGTWECFDEVVFATHSDDTLRLLSDADPFERANLGAIKYQPNQVVLHADASVMPKRKKVWSSWNYCECIEAEHIDLTYWMNSLQPIPTDDPMFVTLNGRQPIREDLIYDETSFRHPVYDRAALQAQAALRAMNGAKRTWFAGAWMHNGFHEDGFKSAVDVVTAMARVSPQTALVG